MSKNQRSIRFVIPFVLFVILSLAAVAIPQSVAEMVGDRLDPKGDDRSASDRGRKGTLVPSNDLITATTYAFSTAAGVGLEDMSTGSTQLVAAASDDGNSTLQNIGFEFWYDGVRFTQFGANANGFIRLGAAPAGASFTNDLDSVTNAPKIMPFWDDLCTGTNGSVRFKTIGAAPNRKLIVEWQNMQITRGAGCAGVGTGTIQLWLFESGAASGPGVIQFVYSALPVTAAADGGYSVGLQSGAATNFASVTTATNTVSYATATDTQTTAIAAGTSYLFTPNVPAAPTALNFTAVTQTSMTLNWTDSANETIYAIYRSTDGINFAFDGTAPQNAVLHNATGLSPGVTYFWNVYAVSEGALSTALSGSQITSPAGNIACAGGGGLWSAPATWAGGIVPGAGDNITIVPACTVTIDVAASALSVTVLGGGILQYEQTTARTLTVGQDVTLNGGGFLQSNPAGTQTGHVLSIGGNLTNFGTIDFSTNGNTAGAGITFTGASDASFTRGGASTTDLRQTGGVIVNKGTNNTPVLSFFPAGALTVQEANTAGFLTITNGTFKMDGTGTFSNPLFSVAAYAIPATGGLWMNNGNATVVGQNGSPTLAGRFQMTAGTFNIGTASGNSMGFSAGANLLIEGGAINATGRFGVAAAANAITYNQTNGTITACTIGHVSTTLACFDLGTGVGTTNINGGTVVIQIASTAASGPRDFRNQSGLTGTATVTGGTVQFGNAASGAAQAYDVAGVFPNIVIDTTVAGHTVTMLAPAVFNNVSRNITIGAGTTFNVGSNVFLFNGLTMTNDGTFTGNGAGTNFVTFLTTSPQTIAGTGTFTAPITNFAIQSDSGLILNPTGQIPVGAVRLFSGSVTNSNKFTLGNGGATTGIVQIGNTSAGLPTACGTFDLPFTFNLGTGGQTLSYLRCTASRSTGPEINPARTLTSMTYDDNNVAQNLTLAGGDLTITGAMTLTNGVLLTGNANTIIHNGAAARTTGLIDGNLRRTYTAIGTYTFFVGQNGFSPVTANVTAGVFPATLTARVFDSTLQGFSPAQSISRNWSLEEGGDITADLSFTYLPADVNGIEAAYRVFRREAGGVNTDMCGAPCVAPPVLGPVAGVTSFSRWTGAENVGPTAAAVSLSGRVTTADGRGIINAIMTIEGLGLPQPRLARTGPFGYYEFTELQAGQTYIVSISSKRFTFTVPSRAVQLLDNVGDFDFVAEP